MKALQNEIWIRADVAIDANRVHRYGRGVRVLVDKSCPKLQGRRCL